MDGDLQAIGDVVGPQLRLLLVGINPGVRSAEVGAHFAHPANRFWPALRAAGITPEVWGPDRQMELLRLGVGITNLVARPSARADEVTAEELRRGAADLTRKVEALEPRVVAVLGLTAYRTAFGRPRASIGPQPEPIGQARLWLLPNPSGLNAHYQIDDLVTAYAELREALDAPASRRRRP